jgi:hypothetical protein
MFPSLLLVAAAAAAAAAAAGAAAVAAAAADGGVEVHAACFSSESHILGAGSSAVYVCDELPSKPNSRQKLGGNWGVSMMLLMTQLLY